MKLEDEAGWMVLRFHHSDADDGWLRDDRRPTPTCSGPGRVGRMTVTDYPAGTLVRRARPRVGRPARRPGRAAAGPPARRRRRRDHACCCPNSMRRRPAVVRPAQPSTTAATPRRARLLRDALRLSFRATAGPFRSFASLAVTPRNYQLVPLLMALPRTPCGC